MTFTCPRELRTPVFMHHGDIKALVHLLDEAVDMVFTVTKITSFNKVLELALAETSSWVGELEWPEEVIDLLEVGANGVDLVNNVFNANNAILSKRFLNDGVVSERNTLLVDLAITTLVNQLAYRLEIWVTVGDIRLNNAKHLNGGLRKTDENTVIDLKETKKLESLALLWINLVDTLDTNHKGKLWFSRNIERTIRFGNSSKTNLFAFGITVLLDVLLSTLEDSLPLLLVCVLLLLGLYGAQFTLLLLRLALFENRLRC